MEDRQLRGIQSADQIFEGLVITFNDGRCAYFNPDFLYSSIGQVREIFESEFADEDEPAFAAVEPGIVDMGTFKETGTGRERPVSRD